MSVESCASTDASVVLPTKMVGNRWTKWTGNSGSDLHSECEPRLQSPKPREYCLMPSVDLYAAPTLAEPADA